MSGAWAKACDRYAFIYGLPSSPRLESAAACIADELVWHSGPESIVAAGAWLRAHRKSLPDKHPRVPGSTPTLQRKARRVDDPDPGPDSLLWLALQAVATLARNGSAYQARYAEACLRTWHKEQRRATR